MGGGERKWQRTVLRLQDAGGERAEGTHGQVLKSPLVVGLGKGPEERPSARRAREWEEPEPHGDRFTNYKFLDWKNCSLHVIGSNGT